MVKFVYFDVRDVPIFGSGYRVFQLFVLLGRSIILFSLLPSVVVFAADTLPVVGSENAALYKPCTEQKVELSALTYEEALDTILSLDGEALLKACFPDERGLTNVGQREVVAQAYSAMALSLERDGADFRRVSRRWSVGWSILEGLIRDGHTENLMLFSYMNEHFEREQYSFLGYRPNRYKVENKHLLAACVGFEQSFLLLGRLLTQERLRDGGENLRIYQNDIEGYSANAGNQLPVDTRNMQNFLTLVSARQWVLDELVFSVEAFSSLDLAVQLNARLTQMAFFAERIGWLEVVSASSAERADYAALNALLSSAVQNAKENCAPLIGQVDYERVRLMAPISLRIITEKTKSDIFGDRWFWHQEAMKTR